MAARGTRGRGGKRKTSGQDEADHWLEDMANWDGNLSEGQGEGGLLQGVYGGMNGIEDKSGGDINALGAQCSSIG